MRKILIYLLFSGCLWALDPTAIKRTSKNSYSIEADAGGIALWQGGVGRHHSPLISFTNGVSSTSDNNIFKAGRVNKVFASGLEGSITASGSPEWDLQLHFLGFINWRRISGAHSDASVLVTDVYDVGTLHDWVQAANVETNSHQKLNFVDLGPWIHSAARGRDYFRLSGFLGLRYLDYYDRLQMTSQRGNNISHFYTTCTNHFAGGLGGFELEATPMSWFSWTLPVVGGLYLNFIKKTSVLHDYNDTTTPFAYGPNKVAAAYTFETSPTGTIRAGRYVRFHIGYRAMYIAKLAMSPYQISPDTPNYSIWRGSALTFQAATMALGLEF